MFDKQHFTEVIAAGYQPKKIIFTSELPSQKAIMKVLTSATFIRGVMGVLNKLLK